MQKLLTVSAGAVLALLGIAVFVVLCDEPSVSCGIPSDFGSSGVPAVLLAANGSRLPVALPNPSVGFYRAALDTIPVVALRPVDEQIGDYPPFWGDPTRISRAMSRFRAILPPNPALEPTANAPSDLDEP
jgi:hypothetical protein